MQVTFSRLTANIQHTDTPTQIVAAVNAAAATGADVIGWQEIRGTALNAILNLDDYDTFTSRSVPISWRKDVWALADSSSVQVSDARPRVSPRRFASHVLLRHRATGELVAHVNTHLINGVDGAGRAPRVWRRRQHRKGRVAFIGLMHRLATRTPVIGGGDLNTTRIRILFADPALRYDVPAHGGTHGRRLIDWLLHVDNPRLESTATQIVPLGASDHRGLLATYTLTTEAPMPGHPKTDELVAALRRRGVEVLEHADWGSTHVGLYVDRLTTRPHGLLPGTPVDTLWNHITVTEDDGTLIGDFKADCREVERIGFQRFGTGVSYNFLVDANATKPRIAIGAFLEAKGSHTQNDKGIAGFSNDQNLVALAVAWVGVPGNKLNAHALTAMVQLRGALIEVGALTTTYDDVPHSLVAAKECPTGELRDRLPELRRLGLLAAQPKPSAPTRASRIKAALLAVLNGDDAKGIPESRRFLRGLLASIRTLVNRIPER